LLEEEQSARFGACDPPAESAVEPEPSPMRRVYGVACFDPLPLRMDPVGVADVKAEEVLQLRIAVESPVVFTELGEPRPHDLGRGIDRHCVLDHVAR
jgi:hypothetical protein